MTAGDKRSELIDRMQLSLNSWPPERVSFHGFELLFDNDRRSTLQRRHARTVLAAQHVLAGLHELSSPIVVMKGIEVAQLYPMTVCRPFRDLDLLSTEPDVLWRGLIASGYSHRQSRRADIDHHHLPALAKPRWPLGIEVHVRPNLPAWASIPTALLFETAQPSRTAIAGVLRPRDDLHALLMAMHGWKGGFTRLRDLFDALLLASASDVPVEQSAEELHLGRFWEWTKRFAELELFGEGRKTTRLAARWLLPRNQGFSDRTRTRLLSPYLVANPIRVSRGHLAEYRLSREVRRPTPITPPG